MILLSNIVFHPYLFQEFDASLGVGRGAPLVGALELVEVEERGVEAGLGVPDTLAPRPVPVAPFHEVVVGQLHVLLAAPSLRPDPRMVL